jgi:aryl-alcohol dehydrogenase-like predicted oxidoreductase
MQTRRLGRSELQVSALGLGCWPIGGAMARGDQQLGYTNADDAESLRALAAAIDQGITLFDTADAYGAGHSERLLGKALAGRPDVRVATKFGNTIDEDTRQLTGNDTSPAYVRRALEASLRRLGRDHIDIYQLHTPDVDAARAAELLTALEGFADEGLIGWYGVSTDDPAQLAPYLEGPHFAIVQLQLNVLDGASAALDFAAQHDLGVLCRSPLAMGLLGGNYARGSSVPEGDIRRVQPEWLKWFDNGTPSEDFLARLDAVRDVLTGHGRSLAQGALAWIWARSDRAVPLPGFRTVAQVTDTRTALRHGALSPDEFATVEQALGRA